MKPEAVRPLQFGRVVDHIAAIIALVSVNVGTGWASAASIYVAKRFLACWVAAVGADPKTSITITHQHIRIAQVSLIRIHHDEWPGHLLLIVSRAVGWGRRSDELLSAI